MVGHRWHAGRGASWRGRAMPGHMDGTFCKSAEQQGTTSPHTLPAPFLTLACTAPHHNSWFQ